GPEASRALSKKRKRPKSKNPPTETKYGIAFHTRKSKPLPEGTATHPKDSTGNKQPLDRDITFMNPDEGTAKTTRGPEGSLGDKDSGEINHPSIWNHYTPVMLISQGLILREPDTPPIILSYANVRAILLYEDEAQERELDTPPIILSYANVRAILLSEDEAQESEEDILGVGEEMDENTQFDETQHQSSPPQEHKPTSSTAPYTEASDTNSSSDKILKKYDNTLFLTKQQLVKYLRKVSCVLFERINEDQWEKHEEASVHYANSKPPLMTTTMKTLLINIRLINLWKPP
nr:hypothetical protein [Tanacetum cinerariifolium]